jgi:hypothetical protein
LLTWLAADRALASFTDRADVKARTAAFQRLLRSWIAFV